MPAYIITAQNVGRIGPVHVDKMGSPKRMGRGAGREKNAIWEICTGFLGKKRHRVGKKELLPGAIFHPFSS